jgi:hypothetical protein
MLDVRAALFCHRSFPAPSPNSESGIHKFRIFEESIVEYRLFFEKKNSGMGMGCV